MLSSRILIAVLALMATTALLMTESAHADGVGGVISPGGASSNGALVKQVSYIPIARGAQAQLHVQLKAKVGGATLVMCSNRGTDYYHAYMPASRGVEEQTTAQAILTSAMLAEKLVTVATRWNGSYCEISWVMMNG